MGFFTNKHGGFFWGHGMGWDMDNDVDVDNDDDNGAGDDYIYTQLVYNGNMIGNTSTEF